MTLPVLAKRTVYRIREPGGRQFVCFRIRNKLRACTTRAAKTLVKRLHRYADRAGVADEVPRAFDNRRN